MALIDTMRDFLFDPNWGFAQGPTESSLVTHYEGQNGHFVAVLSVHEEQTQLVFYAFAPELTPAEHHTPMMELLTRANHGMLIGNFELDLDDGEVRYKVSVDVEGIADPTACVKNHLAACISTLDHYLPAIIAVQKGESNALDALTSVEG
jgi:hypothetical protein